MRTQGDLVLAVDVDSVHPEKPVGTPLLESSLTESMEGAMMKTEEMTVRCEQDR